MPTEIEAKLKVDAHEQIIRRLNELGAEFISDHVHTDVYFDDDAGSLVKTDKALRLRRLLDGGRQRFYLTYKGPKEKTQPKKRQEIETEVTDGSSIEKLLSALGYREALCFEKSRQTWRLGNCDIALDELALLGCFVEIEGPDEEEIAQAQSRLGLADLPHIQESYASLVAEQLGPQTSGAKP